MKNVFIITNSLKQDITVLPTHAFYVTHYLLWYYDILWFMNSSDYLRSIEWYLHSSLNLYINAQFLCFEMLHFFLL